MGCSWRGPIENDDDIPEPTLAEEIHALREAWEAFGRGLLDALLCILRLGREGLRGVPAMKRWRLRILFTTEAETYREAIGNLVIWCVRYLAGATGNDLRLEGTIEINDEAHPDGQPCPLCDGAGKVTKP